MEPSKSNRGVHPPKAIEAIAEWLIPHAYRESVLGDLHERYTSVGRYLSDVAHTVPFLLVNQLRRRLGPHVARAEEGGNMFKVVATAFWAGLFLVLFARMALGGFLDPDGWTEAVGVLGNFAGMVVLLLLPQRAIWRSSPGVLRRLYWPTAIAVGAFVLSGIALVLMIVVESGRMDSYMIGVGGSTLLVGLLAVYSLRRTRVAALGHTSRK